MDAPTLIGTALGWLVTNWPSLLILGGLAAAYRRLGKALDRMEEDSLLLSKLARYHSLVHPSHSPVLFNREMGPKDIDPDDVTPCDAKPAKRRGQE